MDDCKVVMPIINAIQESSLIDKMENIFMAKVIGTQFNYKDATKSCTHYLC